MATAGEAREEELLSTLATKVRVLSVDQIARTWWPSASRATTAAGRRLDALRRAGLLEVAPLWARPELPITEPLATWQPGLLRPDLRSIARLAASRWHEPARRIRCAFASDSGSLRFGGRGARPPRESEVTHDLHLARVFLLMRETLPTRARSWIREEAIAAERFDRAEKLPDAQVNDGTHVTAIEFVGAYSLEKIASFHDYCADKPLAYELW